MMVSVRGARDLFPEAIPLSLFFYRLRGGVVLVKVVNLKTPTDAAEEASVYECARDGEGFCHMREPFNRRPREKPVGQMFVRPHETEGVKPESDCGTVRPEAFPRRE